MDKSLAPGQTVFGQKRNDQRFLRDDEKNKDRTFFVKCIAGVMRKRQVMDIPCQKTSVPSKNGTLIFIHGSD